MKEKHYLGDGVYADSDPRYMEALSLRFNSSRPDKE